MLVVKLLSIRYFRIAIIFTVAVLVYIVLSFWEFNTVKKELKTILPVGMCSVTRQSPTETIHRMRILCIILTSGESQDKMNAVNGTWSKRCDKKLFVYSSAIESPLSPYTIHLPVPESYEHLTGKVRKTLEFVYQQCNDSFDWILKCDDDTFIVMDNLRHMLAGLDPQKPAYLGFRLNPAFGKYDEYVPRGYMSGGAGYVINSRALHDVVNTGFKRGACREDGGDEDVEMGKCLEAAGVPMHSTLDLEGKETFHLQSLHYHLTLKNETVLQQKPKDALNNGPWGEKCCSNYPVSFHYVKPVEMYMFEYLL